MKKIIALTVLLMATVLVSGCATHGEVPEGGVYDGVFIDYREISIDYRYLEDVPYGTSNINKDRGNQTDNKLK